MKKLLIIGNGFDLHLHLKSSFRDFFDVVVMHNSFYNDESDYYNSIDGANKGNFRNGNKEKWDNDKIIKKYSEYTLRGINEEKLPYDEKFNFWLLYFYHLHNFPNYDNLNDIFFNGQSSLELINWSDVEFQIQNILSISEKSIEYFEKIIISTRNTVFISGYSDYVKSLISIFEKSLMNDESKLTYKGVLILNLFYLSLRSGWKIYEENLYDFLFNELKEFEMIFQKYLLKQTKDFGYKEKAAELCSLLVDNSSDYNLINFNYTSFYKLDDSTKVNIHSTLKGNGHPIIGISSTTGQEDDIFKKTYFKFSKTYRIMSLTSSNSAKEILPDNVDEIIFYGQSLSDADYLYFENIFNHYKIYDKDSNIKLIFKYSNFEDKNSKITPEQSQVLSAYRLINKFAERNGHKNLLTNQLMYRRICIDLLEEK